MASVSVKLEGLDQIKKDLGTLSDQNLTKALTAANLGAALVQATAKSLQVPDTGALRSSIRVRPATKTGSGVEAAVYTNLEYAAYEEFGTGRAGAASGYNYGDTNPSYSGDWAGRRAKPYLGPAAVQCRSDVKRIFKRSLQ